MASLEGTHLMRNGKLSGAVDLLYYEKINVDVVNPPYSVRDRNSSFFLRTRKGYQINPRTTESLIDALDGEMKDFYVSDVKVVWDSVCDKESGTVYYMVLNRQKTKKAILSRDIVEGCESDGDFSLLGMYSQTCHCVDEKFFMTTYAKGDPITVLVEKDEMGGQKIGYNGIQINKNEGGAMRGYFSTTEVDDGELKFAYGIGENPIQAGDYLVITSSDNAEDSGFCGQVRTIVGISDEGRLQLDSAWSGFKDGEDTQIGKDLTFRVYRERGNVIGFTSGDGVHIIADGKHIETMCDFGEPTGEAKCIVASAVNTDRAFFLYNNGWIHFGGVGRDKFFDSGDALYAGEDKQNIVIYRDYLLALGRRNIGIVIPDSTGQYYKMYSQSSTIGMKNRYAYGEYNGDFLFVSNDNRLLALKVASNASNNMLEFEDVGQYINPYLSAMLTTDEVRLGTDNNELRLFINTITDIEANVSKGDVIKDKNSRTLICKYDTIHGVWTVDKLKYFIIWGVEEGLYYGDNLYGRRGYEDWGWMLKPSDEDESEMEYGMQVFDYKATISAFLLENEDNGVNSVNNASGSSTSIDLFRLASLQKLVVVLGLGRYTNENTRIKITEYRNGFGYEYYVDSLENNYWIHWIGAAYGGDEVEIPKCILSSLNDNAKTLRENCKEGHKVQDPMPQPIRCNYEQDLKLTDHRVCVNGEVFKMAPTMPITIPLGDQENFNSQIFIEIESKSDDILNFGGMLAHLVLAPLGYKGGDGEYMVEVTSSC